MATSLTWLAPVTSRAIAAVIAVGTWSVFRESVVLSVAAVSPHIDAGAVRRNLAQEPGVESVHDLHIWAAAPSMWRLRRTWFARRGTPAATRSGTSCMSSPATPASATPHCRWNGTAAGAAWRRPT